MSTSVYEGKNYADELAAEQFTEAEIQEAMEKLPDYQKYEEISVLRKGTYAPSVIAAFAKLADSLGQPVMLDGYQLAISALKPEEDRRKAALRELQR